jgi:outer membrane protein, heavy metal efflux system
MNQLLAHSSIRKFSTVAGLIVLVSSRWVSAQQNSAWPDAPIPRRVLTAQAQTPPPMAGAPQTPNLAPKTAGRAITLEQALGLATRNNPTLQANQTLILQNKAQEITANLRPNPVLSLDSQYLPLFEPSLFNDSNYWNDNVQFDAGVGYLFERGKKRQHRLDAARTATAVTEAQVSDAQRTLLANAAQLFISALLAKSNQEFAEGLLDSYKKTVGISQDRYNGGDMSRNDLLKIQLQQLQFETDVNSARLGHTQALASLRQFLGFDSVPADYDVIGNLVHEPVTLQLQDLQARALSNRPDLQAAQRTVTASESQVGLAKANGKVDFNVIFDYTRLDQSNLGAFYFNIPLPVFNKNQGEIARTQYAVTQSQFQQKAAEQQVLTDVKNSYEGLRRARR